MATVNINGTYFAFTVTAANATVGATYTNNGFTYTVLKTIAGATKLYTSTGAITNLPQTSGTLTKATGTGDATITFSAYAIQAQINALTYAAGDTLNIYNLSELLIDETPATRPGPITINNTSVGRLKVSNASTTTPIVVSLNAETNDFTTTYHRNEVEIVGDWIQIGTGTGLVSQTLDFDTVVGGVAIDWPSAIWVEVPNQYWFTCTAATSAVGDTYTNNGQTFTVMTAISSGTLLYCSGTGDPASSGNLTRTAGAGTDPIVFSAYTKVANTKYKSLSPGGVQGYFIPFLNCGKAGGANSSPDYDIADINILTSFYGDLDHGPFFQYDITSKVATFGKGGVTGSSLGGCVIPSGSRIIFPNIHFTSNVYSTAAANRNTITNGNGSAILINCANFGRNWGWDSLGIYSDLDISNMACTGRFRLGNVNGTVDVDTLAVAHDCSQALSSTTGLQFQYHIGEVRVNWLFSLTKTNASYPPGISFNNTANLFKEIGNVFGWSLNPSGYVSFPVIFDSVLTNEDAPLVAGPFYCVGGAMTFYRVNNLHVTEVHHSAQANAVAAVISENLLTLNYCQNTTIAKARKMTKGVAPRSIIYAVGSDSYQCCAKDIVYDFQENTSYLTGSYGERIYVSTCQCNNIRSYLTYQTVATKDCRVSNIITNDLVAHSSLPQGNFIEWNMQLSSGSLTGTVPYDAQPFNTVWTNTSKTAGTVHIGPASYDKNMNMMTVVSGTQDVDFYVASNAVYVGGTCEIIFTNKWPLRGISSFSGCSIETLAGSQLTTNCALEVSMRVNDGTDTSTWGSWFDPNTAANWQTALAALSGYDSDKGFFPRYRLITTAPYTTFNGRYLNYMRVTCTPDSTWTPAEIGFVPILVTGQVDESTIALYDNTVPASPVLVKKQVIQDTDTTLDMPYDFDAVAKDFKLKLRKAGYGEVISEDSTYQKGRPAPMSQVQYVVVDEVAAAAITGITVNGGANTVTITSDHTIADIYAYLQWWGMQVANMEYEIPLVTTDSVNYTSSYSWTVNTGVDITGTFAMTLSGGATLTMTGTATSSGNITHTTGTKVWTRIAFSGLTANSRVQIYDTTSSTELYNAVVAATSLEYQTDWTTNHGIRYRISYVNGATAKNFIEANGTFTSSGLSVAIAQTDDDVYIANAISGSTVTGITITPSPARVKINLAGGTVSWASIYAYQVYWLYGATGIADEAAFITAVDTANYILTGFDIRNDSAVALTLTGGWGKDSVTDTIAGVIDVAGSTGNIYVEPDHIVPYNAGTADALTLNQFIALK